MKKLDAQLIELMEKSKKADCFYKIREINKEERSIVHYASTKSADAYETVILPDSFNFRRFEKNPVVFFAHEYRGLPIGRNLWRKSDDTGLLTKTQFTPNQIGDDLMMLYSEDFLRGWSIGFDPMNWVNEGAKEFDQLVKQWKLSGVFDIIFTEVLLYEYSVAPLPANEDSLTAALADGKIRSEFLVRSFGEALEKKKSLPPQIHTSNDDTDEEQGQSEEHQESRSERFITEDEFEKLVKQNLEKPLSDLRSEISDLRHTVMDLTKENGKSSESPLKNEEQKNMAIPKSDNNRALGISASHAVKIIEETVRREIRKRMGKLDD